MTDGSSASEVRELEDSDNDYTPPKRARQEPPSPNSVFGSNGEENIEDTEQGEALVSCLLSNTSIMFANYIMIDLQRKKRTKKRTGLGGLTRTHPEAPAKSTNNKQPRKNKTKKANQVHHFDAINFTSLLTDQLGPG
jgi:hypothetical protein